jgi:hypothetical protein
MQIEYTFWNKLPLFQNIFILKDMNK